MQMHWRPVLTGALLFVFTLSCASGKRALTQHSDAGSSSADAKALATILAELQALPPPDGVNEALFAELKEALREALLDSVGRGFTPAEQGTARLKSRPTQGEKLVSTPPTGAANAVDDLEMVDNGDGTFSLAWNYRNVGDYNQDGIVNISDITPLAVHFNEPADAENEWIDGNGDTVINISDITPLAAAFFNECASYAIETSDDDGATWSEVMRVSFADAIEEPAGTRKRFAPLLESPLEMNLYRVRAYDSSGTEFGPESNQVRFVSQPPTLEVSETTETQPKAGSGASDDPLIVEVGVIYELAVRDSEGVEITSQIGFDTFPPVFMTLTDEPPFTLTVDDELAGDFWVQALWGEVAPVRSTRLYFRVEATLPP